MAKVDRDVVLEQLAIMEKTIDDLIDHMWAGEAVDRTWLLDARDSFTGAFQSWKQAIIKGADK